MKKLVFTILLIITAITVNAQTTTSSSYAKTSSVKKDGKQSSYRTVAINKSGNTYSLRGEFVPDDYAEIKALLIKNLDTGVMVSSGKTIKWVKEENMETAYSVVLTDSRIKINIDKEMVSNAVFENLSQLGDQLSTIISGKN